MANDKVKVATSKLTALANAIRAKSGGSEEITLNDIPTIVPSLAAPPTWANGSWGAIAQALAKHEAGEIDLYTTPGWEIGATRTVPLSAMPATGVGESHVAQDVEFVLMDKNVIDLDGGGKCNFVIGMKDCLANDTTLESGYMNSSTTNDGGWQSCARRTWCNNVFANAVPDGLKSLVKNATIKTSAGNKLTTINTTTDTWFLPCEYNVLGTVPFSVSGEDTIQWEWYKTTANRIKKAGTNGSASWWWDRSPISFSFSNFCRVNNAGDAGANTSNANSNNGLAPHACI